MIVGLSSQVEIPNIEHMAIVFEAEEGVSNRVVVNIYREELTPERQEIYDKAISLVGAYNKNVINNTTCFMDVCRMTSMVLQEGEEVKDFLTDYTEDQKNDLRAFLAMVIELKD